MEILCLQAPLAHYVSVIVLCGCEWQVKADVRMIKSEQFATDWSLRFPRIQRLREDKSATEVQTHEDFKAMVQLNRGTAGGRLNCGSLITTLPLLCSCLWLDLEVARAELYLRQFRRRAIVQYEIMLFHMDMYAQLFGRLELSLAMRIWRSTSLTALQKCSGRAALKKPCCKDSGQSSDRL